MKHPIACTVAALAGVTLLVSSGRTADPPGADGSRWEADIGKFEAADRDEGIFTGDGGVSYIIHRVEDVTEHPAFAEAARSIAALYDIAASPEHRDVMIAYGIASSWSIPILGSDGHTVHFVGQRHTLEEARRLLHARRIEKLLKAAEEGLDQGRGATD